MNKSQEECINIIQENEEEIAFLKDCLLRYEDAMRRGLGREHVMPEYIEDLEKIDYLTARNKDLLLSQ